MKMDMTGANGILSVPSEHLPGLIALVVFPLVVGASILFVGSLSRRGVGWAEAADHRRRVLSPVATLTLFALGVGAVVHLALVPTHWGDERTTATLFVIDTVGFVAVGVWTFLDRRYWRVVALAMLGGTAAVYVLYILMGWEDADAVGIITTTIELAGALILLVPATTTAPATRSRWAMAAAVPLALVVLLGTSAIADVSTSGTDSVSASPTTKAGANAGNGAMPGMSMPSNATTKALSLATDSPAGAIVWPSSMASMAPGMEMVPASCTAQPTATEQKSAVDLVDQTMAAVAPYTSLTVAKAAGYVPITPTGRKVVHYINYSIARSASPLDPAAVPALVYVNTNHGAVLSAALYFSGATDTAHPPQPGGCLTQWHLHDDLCFSGSSVVGNDTQGACAAGSINTTTRPMMHIWVAPVAGGPLAPDPPAINEVQAAAAIPPLATLNGTA